MSDRLLLERRLERLRAARTEGLAVPLVGSRPRPVRGVLAERLAARLGGEVVRSGDVAVVRVESGSQPLAIDRARLASLPGQPPPDVPLVCLDTETTGLGTATGTLVFLVGLGWWDGDRFRQRQLLLPDHADEPALLAAVAASVPAGAWLVTYNGRSFDWPLLETRYRLRRQPPPDIAGHLDLRPVARRLFRHRLADARLRTVERGVLGMTRYGDVDGALIPGRYLDALRLGDPEGLVDVVRHNDLDVLALALLLAHVDTALADEAARPLAHPGDLAGLGRAFRREGRLEEALACLDAALAAPPARQAAG
ncbi:MAG TPA: ribonuclease H-like domain-containing protein, partial [Candidatus Dormibacteraeota bacterium]|nr:ribonuclease H-like domain-containing protein [Candidatus Dormibacteraeota bacterium]